MAHKRTGRPAPRHPLVGYCTECDKVRYMTRADARAHAAKIGKRMRPYRCPLNEQFWHLASWQPQGRVTYYRDQEERHADKEAG